MDAAHATWRRRRPGLARTPRRALSVSRIRGRDCIEPDPQARLWEDWSCETRLAWKCPSKEVVMGDEREKAPHRDVEHERAPHRGDDPDVEAHAHAHKARPDEPKEDGDDGDDGPDVEAHAHAHK